MGQERGSSVRAGPGHGKPQAEELWGFMDATHLFMYYRNLAPLPAHLEVGRLRRVCEEVSSLCTNEGAQMSSSASPCPPRLSLCLSVHVCMRLCADLIVFFFITFSNVYGPWDWKRSIYLIAVRQGNGL